jgi:hypothetical protein
VAVTDGSCADTPVGECAIPFEGAEEPGVDDGVFGPLEAAFCGNADDFNSYCAAHLNDPEPPCSEGYQPYN